MNYFGLIFYQWLILLVSYRFGFSQEFDYELDVQQVSLDGVLGMEERLWEPVVLSKFKHMSTFIFRDRELNRICGGRFSWLDIEIVEVFGRVVRFSLIRQTNYFYVNMLFVEQSSVSKFFAVIRSRQSKEFRKAFRVKLVQYQISDPENTEIERLQLLAESAAFYTKNSGSPTYARPKTINIAEQKAIEPSESVYLVLQSMALNFSPTIDSKFYVLCALNISTYRFILHFTDDRSIRSLFSSAHIKNDLNPQIPCDTGWLTPEILEQIKSL